MRSKILVVDDEAVVREFVGACLQESHDIVTAANAASGMNALRAEACDVVIVDVRMPGGDGRDLVREAVAEFPDLAIIVISGQGTTEEFADLLRAGAMDYLLKPFGPEELGRAVERALRLRHLARENARLRRSLPSRPKLDALVGDSTAMQAVKNAVAQVADQDTTVLIQGASGTGKELAARAVHELSARSREPFVAVHCGALPEHLLESELFGHVRGAFTGADRHRAGRFEEAHGGTLFLDEVGTMTESVQVRLLRALSAREITRVGESRPRPVDVRIVAATNADLDALVADGSFREDLLFRLNVFPIRMPDLSERPDDIEPLTEHLLAACCERAGRPPKQMATAALQRIVRHPWPGNVRELENAIERAVILAGPNDIIEADDILISRRSAAPTHLVELEDDGVRLPELLADIEERFIRQALDRTEGNRQQAARLLGLNRTTLVQKLKRRLDSGS